LHRIESYDIVNNQLDEMKDKDSNENKHTDDLTGSTVQIIQANDLKSEHLGFTCTLLLAMFAAMIGTGTQFGYALGVMNAPSEVKLTDIYFSSF
jgi:hypothetical protein